MAPKKKEAEPAEDAGDLKASMETELVIAVLKSRLGRYQEAGEKLAVEGFKLTDELAKQKLTLQDINEFLTTELKARSVATTQLEERVVELTAKMQEVQRDAQAEAARVKAEAAAEIEAATSRAAELTSQLEGSSEFLQQREAMESQLTQLRAALAAKTKEVEQKLSDLERRHLQDKERARQEMANKIRETKIAMAQLADQHLEGSTKRTLAENEAMAAQLAYHEAASARLVEANNALRAEIGELRRELGVAHKTVESTAQKNLLLQQTIKAILRCLQQEGETAEAAAAAAASVVSGSTTAAFALSAGHAPCSSVDCYGETGEVVQLQQCLSFTLQSDTPAAAVGATPGGVELSQQQQQTAAEQGSISIVCTGNNLHSSLLSEQIGQQCNSVVVSEEQQVNSDINQQQQQGTLAEAAAGSRSVTNSVVLQLEQQVLQLSDELAAAKQALAAAMQGLLPEGYAAKVVVLHSTNTSSDTAQQQHWGSRGLTSPAAQSVVTGSTEDKLQLEGGLGGRQSPNATVRSGMMCSSHTAFTDRSAAQQQQQLSKPDSPSSRGGWVSSRNIATGGSSRSATGRNRSSSPASPKHSVLSKGLPGPSGKGALEAGLPGALCATGGMSAALDDGVAAFVLHCIQQLRYNSDIGRQQPGCSSLSPSACTSPIGRGAQRHSSVAAVTGLPAGVDSEAAAREYLARLLLEQLHGYARYKVAAFQGLGLELPDVEPASTEAAKVASTDAGVDAAEQSRAISSPVADRFYHCNGADSLCNVWLPPGGGEQQPPQSVLPPLPTLLGMAPVSPAGTAGRTTPSSVGCNHASSGVRSSTEDLFSAILSDARPWGGSRIAVRGPPVSLGQQQQQCSQTTTSPAGLHMQQQCSSAKVPSPKLPYAGMQNHGAAVGTSNKGFGSGGTSAGRLARAAEAAAVTGYGALGELLGEQLRSRSAGAPPAPS